ncbi:hypothetical protein Belba_3317 [Belliella baltica DSM 15883]|uniref:Uncharacterized protein n=1 Tax=Belliella baltica (strain DSM 15883 / CIP 108006 / LMG 21964 / BA134) TaxID=866536 RepID=I3Z9A5_BELBD|nr:hypothetical protein [Belliella baltica]AFL85823.1 hypothetical protein Belba_3317 [Belliella baltica DSM 15883]
MEHSSLNQRVDNLISLINQKAQEYRRKQIQQYEIEAMKRLPQKFGTVIPEKEVEIWMEKFEKVIQKLPSSTEKGTPYVKAKNELFRDLNKKYKIQRKGQWTAIMLPVFMSSIGVAIGASTGNLALWIPIGIIIGFVVGRSIDKNAEKKGLVF